MMNANRTRRREKACASVVSFESTFEYFDCCSISLIQLYNPECVLVRVLEQVYNISYFIPTSIAAECS